MRSETVNGAVTVTVPATTANLGPGFDCLGAALTLWNQFTFALRAPTGQPVEITVSGSEAERVKTDTSNLVYQALTRFYDHFNQSPPPVQITIQLGIPLARGLGSSATAIVGGLMGANGLAGFPMTQEQILQMAIDMEGHPDNVVPALLGGCRLAATTPSTGWQICEIPWHPDVVPVVAIPNFELSTQAARQVLPTSYSRGDAVFNAAHLGLLVRGLETGNGIWLNAALQDRIHQPYRQSLIPGYAAVQAAAMDAGAHGMVISGAGPTLLALATPEVAEAVQSAMESAWADQGTPALVKVVQLDNQGAIAEVQG
jgi:homoserine kinase